MKLSKYNLYVEKTKKKSVRPKILNFDADHTAFFLLPK